MYRYFYFITCLYIMLSDIDLFNHNMAASIQIMLSTVIILLYLSLEIYLEDSDVVHICYCNF